MHKCYISSPINTTSDIDSEDLVAYSKGPVLDPNLRANTVD